jgi:TonB family protein
MLQKIFLKLAIIGLLGSKVPLLAWTPDQIPGLRYPRAAQLARLEGVTVVECEIDQNGAVSKATVKSGHPALGKAAATAAKGWHFRRSKDATDELTLRLTFEFRLVGSCKTQCCNESFLLQYPDHVVVTAELPGIQPSRSH